MKKRTQNELMLYLYRGILGVIAVGIFITPPYIRSIIITIICCFVIMLLFWLFKNRLAEDCLAHPHLLLFDLIVLVLLGLDFYQKWIPSSKLATVAGMVGISVQSFLVIVILALSLMALGIIDTINSIIKRLFLSLLSKISFPQLRNILIIGVVSVFEYLMVEVTTTSSYSDLLFQGFIPFAGNIALIIGFNLVLCLFFQKELIAVLCSLFIFAIWGICNYYTILYHGSPLYLSELVNVGTAWDVMGQYRYNLSGEVIAVVLLFIQGVFIVVNFFNKNNTSLFVKRIVWQLPVCVICMVIASFCFQFTHNLSQAWMPWDMSVRKIGFLFCTVKDLQDKSNPYIKPDGYSKEEIDAIPNKYDECRAPLPDIILILNETFCDLKYYTDLKTDVDYMESFYSIEGATFGNAIVPNTGGGTNNSEIEFLMSKSMYLFKSPAPFTYLKSTVLQRNLVSYLKELSYVTTSMHCGSARNYNRNIAYPMMGFDKVILDSDMEYFNKYGNRIWTDSDNYQKLIEVHIEEKEHPQLLYLLTYQNHGGYEQNVSELDTVHVTTDFGDLTDDINEYLTSIKMSCEAFKELTDYYSKSDRDVIICMVGDHAPSFIRSLSGRTDRSIKDESINMRIVPYVIWNNFGASVEGYAEYASLVDLVPMVLKTAGLPLSSYYETILEIHDILPIRTSEGKYVDRDFHVGVYGQNKEIDTKLSLYYYMEYNSCLEEDNYLDHLFLPQ